MPVNILSLSGKGSAGGGRTMKTSDRITLVGNEPHDLAAFEGRPRQERGHHRDAEPSPGL
jgi:hypothetical protein